MELKIMRTTSGRQRNRHVQTRFFARAIALVSALCALAMPGATAQASLLVHYSGDLDATAFDDLSGRGNDGIQDGTSQELSETKIGTSSMKINGSATSIDVADGNSDFDRTYTEFSVSMWIRSNDGGTKARPLAGKMGYSGNRGWQIVRGTDNKVGFTYYNAPNGTPQFISSGTTTIDDLVWTHVAVTFSADEFLRFYVDGSLVTEMTEAVDGILSVMNGANSAKFQVGNRGDDINDASAASTTGYLDDFGLWDEALTSQQIGFIYTGGLAGLNLQQALIIPEPASLALLTLGAAWLLNRRRGRSTTGIPACALIGMRHES
jgi:hypothetical protein